MVMVVTALAAAVCYGIGAAVQQRQAVSTPRSLAGRPGLLFRLAHQPLWVAGFGLQIVGFAAHALALRSGPLTVVQMVMSADLVVAVVMVRVWSGRPLSCATWSAAFAVIGGITLFIALTSRGYGHAARPAMAAHAVTGAAAGAAVGAALVGAAALLTALVGLRASGRGRAVLLAVAAGLADTCSAVVTMAFSHVVSHGPAALFTSWTVYALIVCGAANVLLTQTAYQTGRPMVTLPIIAAVTPAASVAIGTGLLGEMFRTGVAGAVAIGIAVVATVIALAWLACSAPHPEPQPVPRPATDDCPATGRPATDRPATDRRATDRRATPARADAALPPYPRPAGRGYGREPCPVGASSGRVRTTSR